MKKTSNSFGVIAVVLGFFLITACTPKKTVSAFYNFETECLNIELDGSETLKAWGSGRNKRDALEQAKKNAVRDVLFKGIRNGNGGCSTRPLITEVNATRKYESYFNNFFRDGGEYSRYISMRDTKNRSYESESTGQQDKYGTVLRVLRSQLKEKLIQDNILKQ